MNQLLNCPSCKALLRIPRGATGDRFTCPRCLADVPVPEPAMAGAEVAGAQQAAAAPGIQTEPTPAPPPLPAPVAAAPEPTSCPRCGRGLERGWAYCPDCSTRVGEPLPGADWDSADHQARRDSRGTSVTLLLLAVLGGLGLFVAAVSSFQNSDPTGFMMLVFCVMVLAAISTGIMYARTRQDPSQRGVGRVVKGTLALAGGLMAGACVITAVVWAFLFVACLVTGGRFL
jgi:LSD1 subclass zinc finger protein